MSSGKAERCHDPGRRVTDAISCAHAEDDGSSPLLSAVGPSRIDLYTGSTNQQTFLQSFADSVDVSKVNSVTGLIPTSTGPDGDWYFIRVTSAALKANATGAGGITYPYEAFSAKFTLNGMSGQFNASVSSQNAAAASTGFGGSTAPAAAAASSTASGMTTTSTPKALAGASSSSSSVSGTASKTGSASGSGASAASASQSSGAQRGLVASGLFVALFSCGLAVIL